MLKENLNACKETHMFAPPRVSISEQNSSCNPHALVLCVCWCFVTVCWFVWCSEMEEGSLGSAEYNPTVRAAVHNVHKHPFLIVLDP